MKQPTGKEIIIRDTLLEKGLVVKDIWHIGLCGWYASVERTEDGENYVDEFWLGSNIDRALENIEDNTTEPQLTL